MKPPICAVCSVAFDPGDGALVAFVADAQTRRFDRRAETPGFVGHRPNSEWFCAGHVAAARAMAEESTLADALSMFAPGIGRNPSEAAAESTERTEPQQSTTWPLFGAVDIEVGERRCATCGLVFPEQAGALVEFFEPYSEKAARSLLDGDARFERPSRRWFCPRHAGPAIMVSRTVTVKDAPGVLFSGSGHPHEYNEVPPGISADGLDNGEPRLGPFVPMPDPDFQHIETAVHRIAPRVASDVGELLRSATSPVAAALGVDHLRGAGSIGTNYPQGVFPNDQRWVPSDAVCAATVWSARGADLAVFRAAARHEVEGEVRGEHVQLLIQHREASIVGIVATAGPRGARDPSGQVLLERLHVAVHPDHRSTLEEPLGALLAALEEVPVDPFDRAPDLVDVDLGAGVIVRGGREGDSHVSWAMGPLALADARRRLERLVPTLYEAFDWGAAPELVSSTERRWTPMDRTVPPNCPFTDTTRLEAQDLPDGQEVNVSAESVHWSDNDIDSVSSRLWMSVEGQQVSLSAFSRHGSAACTSLHLRRPTSGIVVDALRVAFADVLE